MLAEVVALLAPALEAPPIDPTAEGRCVLVDCTLGLGGHAHALLTACPEAELIGLDRDPQALELARERLAEFADRITLVEAVYDELPAVLARLGRPKVQGILLDLGVSSLQIDDPGRGFAYAQDAPLDMRMGRQELTAADVLNTYSSHRAGAPALRHFGPTRPAALQHCAGSFSQDRWPPGEADFPGPTDRGERRARIVGVCAAECDRGARAQWPNCGVGLPLARGPVGQADHRACRS
jgi:hypothetical protein